MKIEGRNVLLISPEAWEGLQLSKHVLANTLVGRGNTVCFWGPPENGATDMRISRSNGVDLVHYRHWFRGVNRFPRPVRMWYYQRLIRRIERLLGRRFDVIWCFDTTRMQEFPAWDVLRILHLVDYDTLDTGAGLIRTADLVLTVAEPISEHARQVAPHAHVHYIGHGLDERWLNGSPVVKPQGAPPRTAAYAGHLANKYVDWEMLSTAVLRHPEIHFHFYGPFDPAYPDPGFKAIFAAPNATFHGLFSKKDLVPRLREADILVFCYRAYELRHVVSNSHKVLEYLSTGNVVVGSYVLSYEGTDLFLMAGEREEFISLFDRACSDHAALDTPAARDARITFARSCSMPNLLDRVGRLLERS